MNPGMMHACGHDGHAAIGLGVARLLMAHRDVLHGTVKLIFQPAEEGVRGAHAIVEKGWLDDADALLASHVAPTGKADDGDVTVGTWGSLEMCIRDSIKSIAAAQNTATLLPKTASSKSNVTVCCAPAISVIARI